MSRISILRVFKPKIIFRTLTTPASERFCPSSNLPENIEELNSAQKSVQCNDRSREMSGLQTSSVFSGSFMASQFQMESNQDHDQQGYDLDGHAHLVAVFQNNLPEPFSAVDVDHLKEGLPEGLSDFVRERGQRWAMEDRIESGHQEQNHVFTQ